MCGVYKWVSRFKPPCICTRWPGERWVEQMSRLHCTTRWRQWAPLRWSSAGWMPARVGRLSAGVGRMRHLVTIRKSSLMAGRWGGYEHCGTRQEYSAVKCNSAGVTVRRVVAPAPQPGYSRSQQAASGVRRVMSASCEVTQVSAIRERPVQRYSEVSGLKAEGQGFVVVFDLSSRLSSLLLRWKAADTVFVVLSFSFQVLRYSPTVAMSLVSTPSTACQSPSACMIARSSAYAYFLETVIGRSEM